MVSVISFFGEITVKVYGKRDPQLALVIVDFPNSATFLTTEEREYLIWIKSRAWNYALSIN